MKTVVFLLLFVIPISILGQSSALDTSYLGDNFVKKNIVGEWKDQNSIIIFKKNGWYSVLFDNGDKEHGKWSIDKKVLTLKGESVPSFSAYNIIFFSLTRFEFQSVFIQEDRTIWVAHKKAKN